MSSAVLGILLPALAALVFRGRGALEDDFAVDGGWQCCCWPCSRGNLGPLNPKP